MESVNALNSSAKAFKDCLLRGHVGGCLQPEMHKAATFFAALAWSTVSVSNAVVNSALLASMTLPCCDRFRSGMASVVAMTSVNSLPISQTALSELFWTSRLLHLSTTCSLVLVSDVFGYCLLVHRVTMVVEVSVSVDQEFALVCLWLHTRMRKLVAILWESPPGADVWCCGNLTESRQRSRLFICWSLQTRAAWKIQMW